MKNWIYFLILFSMVFSSLSAQENEPKITLQSGKSIFEIKQKNIYHIDFILDKQGDSLNYSKIQIGGKLLSASPGEIMLTPTIKVISEYNSKGLSSTTWTNFKQPMAEVSIDKKRISNIYLKTNACHSWENTGGFLIIIGAITTGIIAPLVSINYHTGEMNSHTYLTWAAVGVGLCAISIPLFIVSNGKHFAIKPDECDTKRIWKIVD